MIKLAASAVSLKRLLNLAEASPAISKALSNMETWHSSALGAAHRAGKAIGHELDPQSVSRLKKVLEHLKHPQSIENLGLSENTVNRFTSSFQRALGK